MNRQTDKRHGHMEYVPVYVYKRVTILMYIKIALYFTIYAGLAYNANSIYGTTDSNYL